MAKLDFLIVCERAVIEAETNVLSLIAIVEQILMSAVPPYDPESKQKPFIPHRFTVAQHWVRSDVDVPESLETRCRLIGTDGKQFGLVEQRVDLEKFPNTRVLSHSPGFPWTGLGTLQIAIDVKKGDRWKKVASIGIPLKSRDTPSGTSDSPGAKAH